MALALLVTAAKRVHHQVDAARRDHEGRGGGGAGLTALDAVLPIFSEAGVEVEVLKTEYAGHAGEYARTVPLLDGFVGIGGDGTAHEIANGMMRRPEEERVPVGIIPAGSGNTWAYDLGVDDAAGAAALIARGETAAVDVLAVSPAGGTASSAPPPEQQVEYAVNICGFGMPAAVLEQANALRWLGSAQYELAGLLLILAGRCRPATRPGRASALDAELLLASAGLGGAAR